MKYHQLGLTDLHVSRICLGTMTWGAQNSAEDAAAQLDLALAHGVNFIDTAEVYPVPNAVETLGRTEDYLGQWLKRSRRRHEVVLATKMVGPGRLIREGRGLVAADVARAVEGSLKRLGTDYIDLYQLHWPQRQLNMFGQRDFQPDKHVSLSGEDMALMLEALGREIAAGRIRHIGLSNETPWGVMKYLELARDGALPRMATIQNPYSLLQRQFDHHLGEVAMRENIPLLAYSPLAGGALTGKYLHGERPEGARFSEAWGRGMMPGLAALIESESVAAYDALAKAHGLSLTQMALAFVAGRAHLGANIIGATTLAQLEECLSADAITLSAELVEDIERLHDRHPNPALRRAGVRDAA